MKKLSSREFNNYLQENLSNYPIFCDKALEYQQAKNNKRKKQWSESKVQREAINMWNMTADNIYNKLLVASKQDNKPLLAYIQAYDILDNINDSLADIDFTEDN